MMKMSLTILYVRLGSLPDSENHTRALVSSLLANRGNGYFSVAMTDRQLVYNSKGDAVHHGEEGLASEAMRPA